MGDLVEKLRDNQALPLCPYDRRSPEYWTAPDNEPCRFCGSLNEEGAPNLCRGADTSLFTKAADEIERLCAALSRATDEEALARVIAEAMNAEPAMVQCGRCHGHGYHHGFGVQGYDPDWCDDCGGSGWTPDPSAPSLEAIIAKAVSSHITEAPHG